MTSGRWEVLHVGVYRLRGAPETWRQRAMAACLSLGPDAVLSHRAAAVLYGLSDADGVRVELTLPRARDRRKRDGLRIHWRNAGVPSADRAEREGIPVTSPPRTLLDLAATEERGWVERRVDDALRRRLVSLAGLERWLAEPARAELRGRTVLARIVAERRGVGVPESPLESRVLRLLRAAGLPLPRAQHVVTRDGRHVGRVDLAYPDARVAIEVDGYRHHDLRHSFDAERARGNELEAMGWRVVRVTSEHVARRPDEVVDWVRRALGHA